MNILPKKRWHVRTKDNIARVRRDEAEARKQEEIRFEKQKIAETESRLNLLRSKSGSKSTSTSAEKSSREETTIKGNDNHVDLFSDFQSHVRTSNKEHEKEKKEEQEKEEKKIGYLTYLGQDTNEALKLKSWYEIAPNRSEYGDDDKIEKNLEKKRLYDPMNLFAPVDTVKSKESGAKKKRHDSSSSKHDSKYKKKSKQNSSTLDKDSSKELMDKMRKERLKREERERLRQDQLFAKPKVEEPRAAPKIVQKYHSQFNPHIARQ